jgi:hypothetical protein
MKSEFISSKRNMMIAANKTKLIMKTKTTDAPRKTHSA